MSLWTPCPFCGQPLSATDHDNGCPNKRTKTMNDAHDNRQTDDDMLKRLQAELEIVPQLVPAQLFTTRPEVVEAMQWNGEGDLAAFQAWLWPLSPMYRPPSGGYDDAKPKLTVQVYDSTKAVTYATLPPYSDATVYPGSWVVKLADGKFIVLTDDVMRERFIAVNELSTPALVQEAPPDAPKMSQEEVEAVVAQGKLDDQEIDRQIESASRRGDNPMRTAEASTPWTDPVIDPRD